MRGDPKCPECGKDVPFLLLPKMVNGRLVGCGHGAGHACTNPDCKLNSGGKKPKAVATESQPGRLAKAWAAVRAKFTRKAAA